MELRMYVVPGCEFCAKAKEFLFNAGIDFECIVPKSDPVIKNGMAVMFPGEPPRYPVLIDFSHSLIVNGFQEHEYARIVDRFHPQPGAGLHNGSPVAQQPAGDTAPVVEEASPVVEGTV